MTKPKLEIQNLEEALSRVPKEDRDALREQIKALFADGVPEEAKPVIPLLPGTKHCPTCKGELVYAGPKGRAVNLNISGGPIEPVSIYECEPCNAVYMTEAFS